MHPDPNQNKTILPASPKPSFARWSGSLTGRAAGLGLIVCGCILLLTAVTADLPVLAILAGTGILLCGLFISLGTYLWARLARSTIRNRLLVSFILITLFPALGLSTGSIIVGYYNGRQQALSRMELVAALKDLEIQAWVTRVQNELSAAMNEEFAAERASVVLNLAYRDRYYQTYNKAMRTRLRLFVSQSAHIKELFLVDRNGRVALSTDEKVRKTRNLSASRHFSIIFAELPSRFTSIPSRKRLPRLLSWYRFTAKMVSCWGPWQEEAAWPILRRSYPSGPASG